MLSTVSFVVGFHIGSSDYKVLSDKVIISNLVRQYAVDLES